MNGRLAPDCGRRRDATVAPDPGVSEHSSVCAAVHRIYRCGELAVFFRHGTVIPATGVAVAGLAVAFWPRGSRDSA